MIFSEVPSPAPHLQETSRVRAGQAKTSPWRRTGGRRRSSPSWSVPSAWRSCSAAGYSSAGTATTSARNVQPTRHSPCVLSAGNPTGVVTLSHLQANWQTFQVTQSQKSWSRAVGKGQGARIFQTKVIITQNVLVEALDRIRVNVNETFII